MVRHGAFQKHPQKGLSALFHGEYERSLFSTEAVLSHTEQIKSGRKSGTGNDLENAGNFPGKINQPVQILDRVSLLKTGKKETI